MEGLLSTPFHRVYFNNENLPRVEKLPNQRTKIPIGLRWNTYISEHLIARIYYRYYWDNWGVKAHTVSLEVPVKINRFISVAPFYRYHKQSAADYFNSYGMHQTSEAYYTSDYDLSDLTSQSYGLGVNYAPSGGIAHWKLPFSESSHLVVKSIDIKYSHYKRNTGLKADIVSLGLSFRI